jgi:hypothetical protein
MSSEEAFTIATETQILPNARNPQNPAPPNLLALYTCRDSSTNRPVFLQNKPNSHSDKTNTTSFPPKVYTNIPPRPAPKNKANQTQLQNRQNEDKHKNSKGLCKSTTNNEQRTLFKTNPIKANSPTFFRIPTSAVGNTTASLRVWTSHIDRLLSGRGVFFPGCVLQRAGFVIFWPKEVV